MVIQPLSEEFFCPGCGTWTELFDLEVGWCFECCGHRPTNISHIDDTFLARHADELEKLVGSGMSLRQAKKRVREQIAPHCKVCGRRIIGGNPDKALFCGDHSKYAKRYNVLKNKGHSHEDSLQKALEQ